MDSFALIIFGITGNLAQIKLIPVLYDMAEKNLLPEGMSIVGIARKPMTQRQFQNYFHEALHLENIHHKHQIKEEVFQKLCKKLYYINGQFDDPNFYPKLKSFLNNLTKKGYHCNNRIYYLATYPDLYKYVFEGLQKNKMNKQNGGWVRLVIEKPIGNDLSSAKALNKLVLRYFSEDQVFRLDHYLGKETLQNILTFRFANGLFEPVINKDFVDHVQVCETEDFGVKLRGGYFDQVGALKDLGQNHLLQMLAFATMDAPTEFSNEAITAQRLKILKSLTSLPQKVVFGQYEGYKKEKNVDPNSQIDTFFAFKTFIKNSRFEGVPIYIRGGKNLKQYVAEISIVFKPQKTRLLKIGTKNLEPNVLIYRIQPNEGIVFKILTKTPGTEQDLQSEYMQFCYRGDPKTHYFPEPYEKLLVDIIRGDQTFFNDAEEVEAQWEFIDPLAATGGKPHIYKPGTWGPKEAAKLLEEDGRKWLEPSMDFCRI